MYLNFAIFLAGGIFIYHEYHIPKNKQIRINDLMYYECIKEKEEAFRCSNSSLHGPVQSYRGIEVESV